VSPVDFRVVVPARYAASRLPGKPLREIAGKPLVVHTWERAMGSGAREVLVAADDERIVAAVEAAGGRAVMTSEDHPSGTDRLAEVARTLGWPSDAIVVNLQADEPLVAPSLLRELAEVLHERSRAGMATMATPIGSAQELFDPNVVKVVLDDQGFALYFSRAPIPWVRDVFAVQSPSTELPPSVQFLRHIGMYAYRVGTLQALAGCPPTPLERAERLEQLRASTLGIPIHVSIHPEAPVRGVDTPDDLERVRRHLAN
jgi:3-deoxy-manno-octulosonate cytidylyltransferase (CMP-KDO synthetase)